MAFQPFHMLRHWLNLPSQKTPLNAANLNYMDNSIKEADNRIVQLDLKKAEQALVNTLVKSVVVDAKTGVITVTQQNGTVVTYDLDIERVIANFDITDDNVLVLTLADGTIKEVDLTKFINTFSSTATISMKMLNRVVTAEIIDGSVTMDKLDVAIQGEFRQYMLDAQSARDSALQYQGFSKRYAVGDAVAFPGSETDNAKYYYDQTKANAETASADAKTATEAAETSTAQAVIATQKAANASSSANSAAGDAQIATAKASAASLSELEARKSATNAEVSKAVSEVKAVDADTNARLSKRYAVGGEVPEDAEDNARYYYEQSRTLKEQIDIAADLVIPQFYIDFETGAFMSDKAAQGMTFWMEDGGFYGDKEGAV